MRNWKEVKLKDVTLSITDGKHGDCQNESDSGYYFISAKDVQDWRISYDNARQITERDFLDTHRRTKFDLDDVMMVSTGANIGDIAIAKDKLRTARTTFQKSVAILKADKSKLNAHFLAYFLDNSRTELHNVSSGSAQKNLLLRDLREFKIALPTLITQRRIASILSAYDDLIENNLKRIKLLEELAQRTYEEWFVKFRVAGEALEVNEETGLPEGWERKKLVDIANIAMGQSPKSEFYNKDGLGLPFHQGVSDYGFRFPTNSTWSREGTRYAVKGAILFSVRAPVGRLNIAIEKIILGRGLSLLFTKRDLRMRYSISFKKSSSKMT